MRRWVLRWRLLIAFLALALQIAAVTMIAFVFPGVSNLWVSIFVLVSGALASLLVVLDLLAEKED